jgi:Cdc6-like AAA superfamily ATPase
MKEIEFKPYLSEDILEILKDRCSVCMRPEAIDRQILSIISKACNSDARIALQSLRIAASEADSNDKQMIGMDEMRVAIKAARKYALPMLSGN